MFHKAKSNSAVSPVIGTILLVAIAVILAAIILVVVMGLTGDTNEKKVGLNANPATGPNATLILYGGASIDELVRLEMIDQGSPNGSYVKLWDINENENAFVGIPYLAEGVARPLESLAVYDTRINVRGTFSDGTEVILLVQPMTFYDVDGPPPEIANYVSSVRFSGWNITNKQKQTITFTGSDPSRNSSTSSFYGQRLSGEITVTLTPEAAEKIESITYDFKNAYSHEHREPWHDTGDLTKKNNVFSLPMTSTLSGNPHAGGIWMFTLTFENKDGSSFNEWWLFSSIESYPPDTEKYPIKYNYLP